MSADWPQRVLGDVCEVVNGGTPKTGVAEYWDGPNAWITPAEMGKRLSPYVDETERTLTQAGLDNSSARMLPPQSVILSSRAPIGHLVINTVPMATNQGCKGLVPGKDLDTKFLYYHLVANRERLEAMGTGATFKELSGGRLKEVRLPVPPLAEQRRIVAILDEAFAAIATAKANTEKNLANAGAVFDHDLASIFANRGSHWTMRKLAEVSAVFGRGKSRHRPRNEPSLYGGKYPFVQTGDVRNAVDVIETFSQTYSEKGLAQSKLWPKGTVCITIAANIAESAILGFDSCFPDSMIGAVPDPRETSSEFLLFLLQSFKAHLQAQGKGSAQHNINMGTFEEQAFPFPPLNEQAAIVARLLRLREESGNLRDVYAQKLAALDALKASLLHHAFTGQLTTKKLDGVPA